MKIIGTVTQMDTYFEPKRGSKDGPPEGGHYGFAGHVLRELTKEKLPSLIFSDNQRFIIDIRPLTKKEVKAWESGASDTQLNRMITKRVKASTSYVFRSGDGGRR